MMKDKALQMTGMIGAHSREMTSLRLLVGPVLVLAGCMPQQPAQSTMPEPVQTSGPPGGVMDPQYQYPQPQPQYQQPPSQYLQQGPVDPQAYADPNGPQVEADFEVNGDQIPEPSSDPAAPGYATGDVDDSEIDNTLGNYGDWVSDDDYGRVWRPDTTAVGVDFTPYETEGSWVWSDAGWEYSSGFGWGWLPFHYGRWGWFGNYWGWVPGHQWSPGAVEWRHGGGYVGWRPLSPDNGGHHLAPHDSQWRFSTEKEFGRSQIRGHLFNNPAEGLRVTQPVAALPIKGNYTPVGSASVMRGRLASDPRFSRGGGAVGSRPGVASGASRFQRPAAVYRQPSMAQQPTWRRPAQNSYRPAYRSPAQTYHSPIQSFHSGPSHSSYTHSSPSPTYSHSSGGSSSGSSSHSSGGGGGGGHSGGGGHHR